MQDFTLEARHGFYAMTPNTDTAKAYAATTWAKDMSSHSGAILLPQFFGDAATLASYAIRDGFSLLWGDTVYGAGNAGADALYDEVG